MKIANSSEPKLRKPQSGEPVILFSVANNTFAIAASAVHEIRSTDSLAGVASTIARPRLKKVRHMLQRGQQTYYVVNAGAHFGLPPSRPTLVLVLRNLLAAVLVDRIERIDEISTLYALPRAFYGEERFWYRGLALLDERVVPLVNPAGFLSEKELRVLQAAETGLVPRPHPEPTGAIPS